VNKYKSGTRQDCKRKIVEKCDLTIFPLEFAAVESIRSDLTVQQIQMKAKELQQQ